MTMLHITGGAYTHASIDVNNHRCVNMYPTEIGTNGLGSDDPLNNVSPEGIGNGALVRSPGCKEIIDLGGSECRGLFTILNKYIYVVVDNKLYQLTIDPNTVTVSTSIFIGNLNTYSGPVNMTNNNTQLLIVDGSPTAYMYMSKTYGTATIGPIGGTVGDTYNLTINSIPIFTNLNVNIALTADNLIATINLYTNSTGITATSGGTGTVVLTAAGPTTITISESGIGFVSGTNGLTVAGGGFSSGSITAYQVITASNSYTGGSTVIFNDGYFLYNQTGTNYVWNSSLQDGSQTGWNALAYFTAETKPCIVQGLCVNKGEIWVFGDTLTEVWFDAANAPPGTPYSYRVGSGMDIGCTAPYSIVATELINIWLDSRGFVVISDISPYIRNNNSGYSLSIVSTPALHAEWATYTTLNDAIGTYFVDRGHVMYMISFPSAQKTWVYDFPTHAGGIHGMTGNWHERTYLNPATFQEDYYLVQYIARLGQLNVGGGSQSGKIYDFSFKHYDDDGAPIRCIRTTCPSTEDFKYLGIDKLSLRLMTGEALQTGNGSMPQVMLRYSNDGSHTWSNTLYRDMGRVGQYNHKITWNRLGSAEEWVMEFSIQEPIDFSIIKASVEVTDVENMF